MLSSEVVAAVGVFLGLLFVGWEIRQNTLAARAAAYQAMGGAVSSIWLDAAADPGRARVWLRFHEVEIAESPDKYSDEDIDLMIVQMIGALRQLETTWRQVQLGLLAAKALEGFGWNADNRPGVANLKYVWPRIKPHMSPDFAAVVEDTFFS